MTPRFQPKKAETILRLGKPAQALVAFGRALALSPRSADAFNNRGAALLALDQRQAAREDFERALAIDPCQFDARLNLLRLGILASPRPLQIQLGTIQSPSRKVTDYSRLADWISVRNDCQSASVEGEASESRSARTSFD